MELENKLQAQDVINTLGQLDTCLHLLNSEIKIHPTITSLQVINNYMLDLKNNLEQQITNYEQACVVLSNTITSLKSLITDINKDSVKNKQQVIKLVYKRIDKILNDSSL